MVRVNDFEVEIKTDSELTSPKEFVRNGAHYVAMQNGATYQIMLRNGRSTRADVNVTIDGESIGSWVVRPYSHVLIERHANIARKFTFFNEKSSEASSAGVTAGASQNGLVKVTFKPEKVRPQAYAALQSRRDTTWLGYRGDRGDANPRASDESYRGGDRYSGDRYSVNAMSNCSESTRGGDRYSSGVTLLGEESRQRFNTTTALTDDQIDHANITEITLRMVVDETPREKFVKIPPFVENTTAYPPRLDAMNG